MITLVVKCVDCETEREFRINEIDFWENGVTKEKSKEILRELDKEGWLYTEHMNYYFPENKVLCHKCVANFICVVYARSNLSK